MFKGKKGQQSFLVIICIIIIILIIVFAGLGELFGVASDAMCVNSAGGVAGWFFCNWIEIILFMLFIWISWMVFKG